MAKHGTSGHSSKIKIKGHTQNGASGIGIQIYVTWSMDGTGMKNGNRNYEGHIPKLWYAGGRLLYRKINKLLIYLANI